jgi:hypothetical protein
MSMAIRQALTREAYSDRNETLFLLGFKTYGAYLRSKLWKIVRQRALDIHGAECRRCGQPATQAHHASYLREVLIGEDVRGLVPVCAPCHKGASVTRRGSPARRIDRLRVRHLHDTNAKLAKKSDPPLPREPVPGMSYCECGRQKRASHLECRACDRSVARKKRTQPKQNRGWIRRSTKAAF